VIERVGGQSANRKERGNYEESDRDTGGKADRPNDQRTDERERSTSGRLLRRVNGSE
jgi:hypothetical protein